MIYFDNAATTIMDDDTLNHQLLIGKKFFANSSSSHGLGISSQKALRFARNKISSYLGCDEKNIIFTSSGTEANALSISLACKTTNKNHIITTTIEHNNHIGFFKQLEENNFDITYLTPDTNGQISINDLVSSIKESTFLISVMFTNNETGVIQPIKEIYNIAKGYGLLFHCDCVQAIYTTKIADYIHLFDFASFSAHKVNGPKGVGILYRKKCNYHLNNSNQEYGIRPGTVNLQNILTTAYALETLFTNQLSIIQKIEDLNNYFRKCASKYPDFFRINNQNNISSPTIISIQVLPIEAEIFQMLMSEYEIYFSTKSACTEHHISSRALSSMGLSEEEIKHTIRISFDKHNTCEEIDIFFETSLLIFKMINPQP